MNNDINENLITEEIEVSVPAAEVSVPAAEDTAAHAARDITAPAAEIPESSEAEVFVDDYFDLCTALLAEIDRVHENSRRYIKRALIFMLILPAFLIMVNLVTGTSKITIMFFWLIIMFLLCGYLIFVEYTDHRLMNRVSSVVGGIKNLEKIRENIKEYWRSQSDSSIDEDEDSEGDDDADNADLFEPFGKKTVNLQEKSSVDKAKETVAATGQKETAASDEIKETPAPAASEEVND